ncbi:hypothetical protein AARAC_000503 [Aspergillus arachidicola]|uniref:Uncharacterized protein n=1 Tax=Aspergillus arachidicola TaxID=656916 RepID=A0A2G7G830_9EURO|nr:hypothetical protein AARAC_000503 [Aspergillus arachidicola]
MATGDSGLPSAEYTTQLDDSDESSSEYDITWSPGDGVCPTTVEFNHCCQSKTDDWKNAAASHLEGTECFQYYLSAFLGLFENIPPFYHCPPGAVNISGRPKSFLVLKSSLQVKTTEDSNCNKPQKSIDYLQCLGSPAPVKYRTKAETKLEAAIPVCAKPLRSGYFTNIVLAWSYIISCRWVEILQQAGEESQILHEHGMQVEDSFWDIVTQGYWVARAEKFKGVFYSPWMVRREGSRNKRGDRKPVIPNSSLAFDILLGFCLLEGLEGEFLAGFASVLILTSRHAPPPKFAPPIMIARAPMRSDALDSLLCSTFFDPCVPCNFIGAASLGVKKALSIVDKIDNRQLLFAVTNIKPHLSLLWAAAVCNDHVTSFLNMALRSLPPICLVTAFCTNTAQSFLQIAYPVRDPEDVITSRALEFQTSYFCRPELPIPWSPAPPFGTTSVGNLSLEVRAHLAHIHRPISWRLYWVLNSGERILASAQHPLKVIEAFNMCHSCSTGDINEMPHPEQYIADEQSGFATSRLFNWHRSYDDGIWLDDGQRDTESVRQLQIHPWIIDPFDSPDDEPVDEPKHHELCVERILQWNNEVEKCRQAEVERP